MTGPQVWYWNENYPAELGVSVPRADQDQALRIFLEHENIDPETVAVDTLRWLHDQMRFVVLWSVITADVEGGDVGEADIGSYHSNGTGRRHKPAWFIRTDFLERVA